MPQEKHMAPAGRTVTPALLQGLLLLLQDSGCGLSFTFYLCVDTHYCTCCAHEQRRAASGNQPSPSADMLSHLSSPEIPPFNNIFYIAKHKAFGVISPYMHELEHLKIHECPQITTMPRAT